MRSRRVGYVLSWRDIANSRQKKEPWSWKNSRIVGLVFIFSTTWAICTGICWYKGLDVRHVMTPRNWWRMAKYDQLPWHTIGYTMTKLCHGYFEHSSDTFFPGNHVWRLLVSITTLGMPPSFSLLITCASVPLFAVNIPTVLHRTYVCLSWRYVLLLLLHKPQCFIHIQNCLHCVLQVEKLNLLDQLAYFMLCQYYYVHLYLARVHDEPLLDRMASILIEALRHRRRTPRNPIYRIQYVH